VTLYESTRDKELQKLKENKEFNYIDEFLDKLENKDNKKPINYLKESIFNVKENKIWTN